jgi:hypothetical protein
LPCAGPRSGPTSRHLGVPAETTSPGMAIKGARGLAPDSGASAKKPQADTPPSGASPLPPLDQLHTFTLASRLALRGAAKQPHKPRHLGVPAETTSPGMAIKGARGLAPDSGASAKKPQADTPPSGASPLPPLDQLHTFTLASRLALRWAAKRPHTQAPRRVS